VEFLAENMNVEQTPFGEGPPLVEPLAQERDLSAAEEDLVGRRQLESLWKIAELAACTGKHKTFWAHHSSACSHTH